MLRHLTAGLCPALALCACAFVSPGLRAQTTDAYHAIQVLPVVVDTASFAQRFNLHNASQLTVTITPTYYPAEGTAQVGPLVCPSFVMGPVQSTNFASLREVCPALVAGGHFGTLVFNSGTSRPFAVYSRVSNMAGAGFSVEAFPASAFSGTLTMVTGLRRTVATASEPAYQTNCFIGNLGQVTPAAQPATTDVKLELRTPGGNFIGSTVVPLVPGKLVRLLDVFAAVGQPTGEFDNATAEFSVGTDQRGGVISFCTVQDNTSFGADFRIAKQQQGNGVMFGTFDVHNARDLVVSGQTAFDGLTATSRKFEIPAGASSNVHVFYFRHPDTIGCALWNANTNAVAAPSYGLEMRLIGYVNDNPGTYEVIAGGNDVVSFSNVFLGDREERGHGGNSTYWLQVESNGQNEGALRRYKLKCQSGTGHNLGEMIQTGGPVGF
jgi:hypothetical protein